MTANRDAIVLRARAGEEGIELVAPMPGLWRDAPAPGTPLVGGACVGALEVLGVLHDLVVPPDIEGVVAGDPSRLAERPVAYGDVLVRLVALAQSTRAATGAAASTRASDGDRLLFRAPLSGRFYARPSADKPAFVREGDEVGPGQTVALLEVMKTFNRLTYGGAGLPERARVKAVLVRDEDDVDAGTPILELEPVV